MSLMHVIKPSFNIICVLILLLCSGINVNAGQENIRFKHLTLEQGLSQESVLAAFQDKYGYMWFGTQEGLNRFDGYQFKVFTHNTMQAGSLSSDWIYSLNETNEGKLWIGTINGINIFDNETQTFSHLKHDPLSDVSLSENNVRVMLKDSSGAMWVGTDAGFDKYDSLKKQFFRYTDTSLSPRQTNKIYALTEDNLGALWVGTNGNGVFRFDPRTETTNLSAKQIEELTGFVGKRIRSLYIDSHQRLWIGTYGEGLSVIDLSETFSASSKNNLWQPEELNNLVISDIYEDIHGALWIASDVGLFRLNDDGKTFQHIKHEADHPYSLSSNKTTCLFEDRGGVFWVGSFSGLNKWNTATAKFDHVRVNANKLFSLSANSTNTFLDASEKKIWIGTIDGLNLLNTQNDKIQQYLFDPDNENSLRSAKVTALFARSDKELWIGYRDKGLSHLDRDTGQFTHFIHNPQDEYSIAANGVSSLLAANDGKIWVGVFGGGLNLLDPTTGRFKRYQHKEGDLQTLSSDKVLSITKVSDGALWIGTWDAGITIFNPTTATATAMSIVHNNDDQFSLGSDSVISINEDTQRNIWVGTSGGGLNKLGARDRDLGQYKFEKITRNQGLPSNTVYGALEDEQGMLWLSTNRGITKYDPQSKAILNYDSSHGLQGNEFNFGAYYKAQDGKFYFGGTNGVTSFYPKDISPNAHVPPVVLTRFQRLNETMSLERADQKNKKIQISYKDYLIAFEFAGLDFASPSNNQYMYKLDGFDNDWVKAGDIRRATYTNLPAGNYLFQVKASNNDGIWNEQGADVALTVLPAPWYSWWAYLFYLFVIVAILYLIYRVYVNRLKQEENYRHELEYEVKSRTVELRKVNEQLLSASVTDQLTGLHNRRYLTNIIDQQCSSIFREFSESVASGKANANSGPRLFILMFDLDGFKPINDTYGHDAGDKVICQVGDVLNSVCRKSDIIIRWGGDEFLVIGRVEQVGEVQQLAERLRSAIASFGFDIDLKQKMHLSCSIGYSMYPFSHHYPDSLGWEQVHLLADNALYKSKELGRNQWTGVLQTSEVPPVSSMNTLTQNFDRMIEQGYIMLNRSEDKKPTLGQVENTDGNVSK